ncbi:MULTISPECIES: hypothetical protein [Brachymonas]|uniref:hypothetical protein n=1 Tax=Brachymonas TaxID=28219 RepID=UPI002E7A013C|nr:hypothetical protein [Brachymonas sp. J145]MEE1654521.1 hypothetical protein [Brachymonas sp. J145]
MNRQTLTEQDLSTMTGPELVALHNDCAASLGCEPVKRFGTKADAIRRTWTKVQAWKEKQQEAARRPAPAPEAKQPCPRRGTNVQPKGSPVLPCVIGSKQAVLVDELSRPEGVTMAQLLAALSLGGKPWTEPTVRSGFGWDMRNKGYGVRSSFDEGGTERFRLVVPEGQAIPPHATRAALLKKGA